MNWIRKALGLCQHKWEVYERYTINRSLDARHVGELLVLRCAHCGDVKKKRIAV